CTSFDLHNPAPTQVYTLSLHDALPIFQLVADAPVGPCDRLGEAVVDRLLGLTGRRRLRQLAAEVLADHGRHAGRQVAVVVGQLAGVAGGEVLPGEGAVLAEGDGPQEVPAVRVHAEVRRQVLRLDAGQVRLAHLLAADHQPAVRGDLP